MNEIVNKFLLTGDKFMSEMNSRQSGFTYSASGPFIKSNRRIEVGDLQYSYQNEVVNMT